MLRPDVLIRSRRAKVRLKCSTYLSKAGSKASRSITVKLRAGNGHVGATMVRCMGACLNPGEIGLRTGYHVLYYGQVTRALVRLRVVILMFPLNQVAGARAAVKIPLQRY